jgi:hypothetical protein
MIIGPLTAIHRLDIRYLPVEHGIDHGLNVYVGPLRGVDIT